MRGYSTSPWPLDHGGRTFLTLIGLLLVSSIVHTKFLGDVDCYRDEYDQETGIGNDNVISCNYYFGTEIPRFLLNSNETFDSLFIYSRGNRNITQLTGKWPQVSALEISGTGISSLNYGSFAGLEEILTHLEFYDHFLTNVPTRALQRLPRLKRLVLDSNRIKTLQQSDFVSLTSIQTLNLQFNRITTIEFGTFDQMGNLNSLNIIGNKLTALTSGTFDGLSRLKTLYMAYNDLAHLDEAVFTGARNLSVIDLDNNKISRLPFWVFNDLERSSVYLSTNNLTALEKRWFGKNTSLRKLDLRNNRISKLDREIFSDLSLEEIHLQNNNLTKIESGTFVDDNLHYLDLRDNQITDIDVGAFRGFSGGYLDLGNNRLRYLNRKMFYGCPGLVSISLQNNELTHLHPNIFDGLQNLTFLSVAGNKLRDIPGHVFRGTPNLGTLKLAHNRLTEVDNLLFRKCSRLTDLDLSFNRIAKVHEDAFKGLQETWRVDINLSNNFLSNNLAFLRSMEQFGNLRMSDNPIDCTCDVFWLRYAPVARKLHEIRCHTPERLKGYLVECFPLQDCPPSSVESFEITEITLQCNLDMQDRDIRARELASVASRAANVTLTKPEPENTTRHILIQFDRNNTDVLEFRRIDLEQQPVASQPMQPIRSSWPPVAVPVAIAKKQKTYVGEYVVIGNPVVHHYSDSSGGSTCIFVIFVFSICVTVTMVWISLMPEGMRDKMERETEGRNYDTVKPKRLQQIALLQDTNGLEPTCKSKTQTY